MKQAFDEDDVAHIINGLIMYQIATKSGLSEVLSDLAKELEEISNKEKRNMKKELFWIRGSKGNPKGVKDALRNAGIIVHPCLLCNIDDRIIFGCKDEFADYAEKDTPVGRTIMECGTELEPYVDPSYNPHVFEGLPIADLVFKPFDPIIGLNGSGANEGWIPDFFAYRLGDGFKGTSGLYYSEIHHYQSWMSIYITTKIPFKLWRKEE